MAEERENLNEFKRWDAIGAAGFLAIVPAVMCYVFTEHNIGACIVFAGIAAGVTAGVAVLTFIFPETVVGRIVNLIGNILAPTYLVVAVCLFWAKWSGGDAMPMPAGNSGQETAPAAPDGQP